MSRLFVSTSFLPGTRTSFRAALEALAGLELDGVELASTHRAGEPFADIIAAARLPGLLVHNYFPPGADDLVLNIASEDAGIANRSIAHIRSCIDFAAEVGASLYTFHPGFTSNPGLPPADKTSYDFAFSGVCAPREEAFTRMLRAMETVIAHAERCGVPVAVESEGSRRHPDQLLLQRPEEFVQVMKAFGSALGITLNLAHTALAAAQFGFSVADVIEAVCGRIRAVEISHCDGVDDQHRPLEPGSFVFRHLPMLPKEVPWILEFRDCTVKDLDRSLYLLRSCPWETAHA